MINIFGDILVFFLNNFYIFFFKNCSKYKNLKLNGYISTQIYKFKFSLFFAFLQIFCKKIKYFANIIQNKQFLRIASVLNKTFQLLNFTGSSYQRC